MDQQRFDELLQAELDGVLSDGEAAELDEACEANREFCITRDRDARLVTLLRSRGPEPAPPDLLATAMARIPAFADLSAVALAKVEASADKPAGEPEAEAETEVARSRSIAEQDTVKISDETIRELAQVDPPALAKTSANEPARKTKAESTTPQQTREPVRQPVSRPREARAASRPSIWTTLFGTPLRWGFGMAVPAVVVFMLLEMGRQESEVGAGGKVALIGGGGAQPSEIALAQDQNAPARPAEVSPARNEVEIASAQTPGAEASFFGRIPEPGRESAPRPGLDSGPEPPPDIGSQSPPIFSLPEPAEALAKEGAPTKPSPAEVRPRTIASALPGSDDEVADTAREASIGEPVRSDGALVWSPPPAVSRSLIPERAAEIPTQIQIAGLPENMAETINETVTETEAEAKAEDPPGSRAEVDIAALSQLPAGTDLESAIAETRSRAQTRRTIARSSDPAKPANAASARRSIGGVTEPDASGGPQVSDGLNLEIHLASARAQSGTSRTTIPRSRSGLTIGRNGTSRSLSGGVSRTGRGDANDVLTARRISYLLIRHGTLLEDRPDEKDPTIQHIRARLTRAGYEAFLIDLREMGLAQRTARSTTATPSDSSPQKGLPADAQAKAGWFAPGAGLSSGVRTRVNPREEIIIQISVHASP